MKMKFVYQFGTTFDLTQSMSIAYSQSVSSYKAVISMLEELKKNDAILISRSFALTMTESQAGYSQSIDAKFRVKNIIVKFNVDVDQDTNFEGDPGLYMSISVWTASGAKVADVYFEEVEPGYWVPYFRFADDTTAPITDFFNEDLNDEMGNFVSSFMDFGFKK
jgi:hypothetical protein